MGLKSIASRTEEVVPIFAIPKLIMEPVKKRGCKGGEVGNLSPLTVGHLRPPLSIQNSMGLTLQHAFRDK